jgi:UDP-2,3-diacylglucosamine hydrolase
MRDKVYFFSDVHLGLNGKYTSLEREKRLVACLNEVSKSAKEIYLLGDIFDIWYEYKYAVPKGFVRIFGKLAELSDSGIKIHFFAGNHDMWLTGYFQEELGIEVHHKHEFRDILGTQFYLGHGHGLGKADAKYAKVLKYIFGGKVLRFVYDWLHPDFGLWLASKMSRQKRYMEGFVADPYKGDDKEILALFVREVQNNPDYKDTKYFVFGHRHIPVNKEVAENKKLVILGNWINEFTYGEFDGKEFKINRF